MGRLRQGDRGGFLREIGGRRRVMMASQLWLNSNVTPSLGGACCCQSSTDGSRRKNRSLEGGPSLCSSCVDRGCRSCTCSFVGTWDTHEGHLGGPGRQRQRDRSLGPPRGRPAEAHGAERPARAGGWGVSQCALLPSKRGQILRPFWKPLGTPVVAKLVHGPRQRPEARGAETQGVSVKQNPGGGKM